MELHQINPNMLILARQVRGITQNEFSKKLNIDQGNLSKIEHGLIRVNDELLNKFSYLLKFPREFFFKNGKIYPSELSLFRKRKTLAKRSVDQITAQLNIQYLQLVELKEEIELGRFLPTFDLDEFGSPKRLAIALRQFWQMPRGMIDNLTSLVEKAGIVVLHLDINSEKFDGIRFVADGKIPIIALNKNMPPDRMRNTLSEELGHVLMHKVNTLTADDEAREFASEFLMPSEDIEFPSHLTITHLADMKRYWRVSMGALLMKAKTMNKVSPRQYQHLWFQMGQLGYKKREPAILDPPPEHTTLINKIFNIYVTHLHYTISDFLKLFAIDVDDFNEWWKPYLQKEVAEETKQPLKLVRDGIFYSA